MSVVFVDSPRVQEHRVPEIPSLRGDNFAFPHYSVSLSAREPISCTIFAISNGNVEFAEPRGLQNTLGTRANLNISRFRETHRGNSVARVYFIAEAARGMGLRGARGEGAEEYRGIVAGLNFAARTLGNWGSRDGTEPRAASAVKIN